MVIFGLVFASGVGKYGHPSVGAVVVSDMRFRRIVHLQGWVVGGVVLSFWL